jgi:acyl-coenzyme A thioesterase PaaI-like protein
MPTLTTGNVIGNQTMPETEQCLSEADVRSFLSALPFVQEYAITVMSVVPGKVTIELPFHERFSGPPGQFPASMVGVAGDVAAVASCLSLLPKGWALATSTSRSR